MLQITVQKKHKVRQHFTSIHRMFYSYFCYYFIISKLIYIVVAYRGGRGGRPVRRADNPTTFMCWLSWNLGASTSWNPLGLSRPVMELFYPFFFYITLKYTLQSSSCISPWKWLGFWRIFPKPKVEVTVEGDLRILLSWWMQHTRWELILRLTIDVVRLLAFFLVL
jgi:hypothetical protein